MTLEVRTWWLASKREKRAEEKPVLAVAPGSAMSSVQENRKRAAVRTDSAGGPPSGSRLEGERDLSAGTE